MSAQAQRVEDQATLSQLISEWEEAKQRESKANQDRFNVECKIYEMVKDKLKESGTNNFEGGLKVVTALDKKYEQDKIKIILPVWESGNLGPKPNFPFFVEYKPDNKAIDYIKENAPGYYKLIEETLTVKPRKPSFSVQR